MAQPPVDNIMEAVGARLAQSKLVSGPATAAEKAFVNEYLVDSDDDADAMSSEIDAFERRLAAGGSRPAKPSKPAAATQAQKKEAPHHLMHLLDSVKIEDAKPP